MDRDLFFPGKPPAAKLRELHLQRGGHHLKKPPRPGRAFVVHHEIRDLSALSETDDLAVLTADVNDAAGICVQIIRAFPVTGYFRARSVGKGNVVTAVAGGEDAGDSGPLRQRGADIGQGLGGRVRGAGAGPKNTGSQKTAVAPESGGICRCRAAVDADENEGRVARKRRPAD